MEQIGMRYWKMIQVEDQDCITLPVGSDFELGSIMLTRIAQIGKGDRVYLDPQEFLVDTKTLDQSVKIGLSNDNIVNQNGDTFVKLSATHDIAFAELNNGKCPYSIIRIISTDPTTMTIYYELVDVNQISKPVMGYL